MFLDHPSFTATDSQVQPDRLARLQRVYGYALALADSAGDDAFADKLAQLHDHKDTLIVFWNAAPGEPERAIFARAWASKAGPGTASVEHEC